MQCQAHFRSVAAHCSRPPPVPVGIQGGEGAPQAGKKEDKLLGTQSLLEQHLSFHTQSSEGCIHSSDSGMLRMALYVNGDPYKQQIYYHQLLTGSSQGSSFIILGHTVQLTSWNILQLLFWNDKFLIFITEEPQASTQQPWQRFWGLNLALL